MEEPDGPPRTELYDKCNPTGMGECTRDACERLCMEVNDTNPVTACEYAGNTRNCIALHGVIDGAEVSTEDNYQCAILN